MGFILTQWGMEVFNVFRIFLHLQWFGVIIDLHFIFSLSSGLLPQFFSQVPCASVDHCKAQLSIFAQVDDVGNAWVAGDTRSSLDGHANAGSYDIFLMKFDAQGVHLWTRQRGGEGRDYARALQADGVRLRFRIFFHGGETWKNFRSSCEVHVPSQVEWHHIQMNQSVGCTFKV